VWVVYLLKFLVRFHCVYSGELDERLFLGLSRPKVTGTGDLRSPFYGASCSKQATKIEEMGLLERK